MSYLEGFLSCRRKPPLQRLASCRQNGRPMHRHLPILPVQFPQIIFQSRTNLVRTFLTLFLTPEILGDHWKYDHSHLQETRHRKRYRSRFKPHADVVKTAFLELSFDPRCRMPFAITHDAEQFLRCRKREISGNSRDGLLDDGAPTGYSCFRELRRIRRQATYVLPRSKRQLFLLAGECDRFLKESISASAEAGNKDSPTIEGNEGLGHRHIR